MRLFIVPERRTTPRRTTPRRTTPRRTAGAVLGCAVLATGLGLTTLGLTTLGPSVGASSGVRADVGSSGIGDSYFPRDGNGGYDVAHYSVRDAYDQGADRLTGSTTLIATATHDLARFDLDLLLPATSVSVDGRAARFQRRGAHELVVVPVEPLDDGATFTVRVGYAGQPGPLTYARESTWLSDPVETVTMNEPHMAPWWFAANDHPLDKASFDIRITHRADQQVIANGELVGRRPRPGGRVTTHWRAREPMAPYLAFFALGHYAVRSGDAAGLPWVVAVSRALPAAQRRTAMRTMLRAPEVVRWLETQVGPYPFSTTGALTTSLDPGFAMENQTRPTFPVLGRAGLSTLVHEQAHQWFGDSVSVAGWRDIWLNEGLATFFEVRWEETHGGPSAQQWLDEAYAERAGTAEFWRLRIADPGPQRLFDQEVYLRGAMASQALRTRIGDAAFFTLLRTWVASRRGGNGSSPQFEALAAQIAGTDLTAFFDAWLRSPTAPEPTAANGL